MTRWTKIKTEEKKTLLDQLISPPRTLVVAGLVLIVIISLLYPLGLPINISPRVRALYDKIETLSEEDTVLYMYTLTPGLAPESGPGAGAVLTHIYEQGAKVIMVSTYGAGYMIYQSAYDWGYAARPEEYGYKYGEDYVDLGYLPGSEGAMATWAQDLHSAYAQDEHGTLLEDLPMMTNIRGANDIDFVVVCTASSENIEAMLRQWPTTYPHIKMGYATGAGLEVAILPYVPDPYVGGVAGIRQSAEYEILIDRPSRGAKFTDVLSLTQSYAILLILVGNGAYIMKKSKDTGDA